MENRNTLYVQMFGNFQMQYGGKPLTGERVRDTHFTSLMQILPHNAAEGVSRDYLEDILLGDRDIENRRQALQTIIYKAKQKLKNMGLPKANYITLEKGIYHWTEDIPVQEDAAVFDKLCDKAAAAESEDEQLKLCMEACYTYKGEFLSVYAGVLWASAEARRYRQKFCKCVETAADILRKRRDWFKLEELGKYVTTTAPYSDWESLIMEALLESERYDEAQQFYADTVDRYVQERGIYPSEKIVQMMDKLVHRIRHTYEVLDQIQQQLTENAAEISGGYRCSWPVFEGIYHIVSRMMERGGQSVYLMLCTLVDGKGNHIKESERLEELCQRLGLAIQDSVRHGDIIHQYGSSQFLILLVNTTRENCDIVKKRINDRFLKGGQRTGVQYHVNSVICEA